MNDINDPTVVAPGTSPLDTTPNVNTSDKIGPSGLQQFGAASLPALANIGAGLMAPHPVPRIDAGPGTGSIYHALFDSGVAAQQGIAQSIQPIQMAPPPVPQVPTLAPAPAMGAVSDWNSKTNILNAHSDLDKLLNSVYQSVINKKGNK